MGVEPILTAWKAAYLPLIDIRVFKYKIIHQIILLLHILEILFLVLLFI